MEALVVFTNENAHWLGRLLHPSFQHVYCVLPTADGCSTEINLGAKGIQTFTYAGTPFELMAYYLDLPNTSRAELVKYDPVERHLLTMSLNNCVGLTKQLLGIRSWSLTPYQLHRYIKPKGQRMRINLTLAGFGKGTGGQQAVFAKWADKYGAASGSPTAPSPTQTPATPATPPPPVPTRAELAKKAAGIRNGAENVRNTGGGRGMGVIGSVAQGLKTLTGQ